MDQLIDALDQLLGVIPFNGNKTLIGLAIHQFLPAILGFFPAVAGFAPPVAQGIGLVVGLVGLLHKGVKAAQ